MTSRILARLARPALLSVLLLTCLSTQAASPASQLPSGGVVTAGTATFSVQGNTLTVTNTSGAVINWQDFSIGSGASARFVQPSYSSVVLNRVVSQSPSTINGSLMSNGRVFLVNPNGALFGAGSVINTAGFTVSTGNATDSQFLANQGANGTGTFLSIDSQWVVGSGNVAVTSSGLSAPDGLGSTPGTMIITTNGPINVGNLIPSGSPIVTASVVALTPGSSVPPTTGGSVIFIGSGTSTGSSTITNNTALVADRTPSVAVGTSIGIGGGASALSANGGGNLTGGISLGTSPAITPGPSVVVAGNLSALSPAMGVPPGSIRGQASTAGTPPHASVATMNLQKREPMF